MTTVEGKLPVGDTGEYLDTTVVPQSDGTEVHREVVVTGDPKNLDARASVVRQYPAATYGGAVADRGLEFIRETLGEILGELKTMNRHLAAMTDEEFDHDYE